MTIDFFTWWNLIHSQNRSPYKTKTIRNYKKKLPVPSSSQLKKASPIISSNLHFSHDILGRTHPSFSRNSRDRCISTREEPLHQSRISARVATGRRTRGARGGPEIPETIFSPRTYLLMFCLSLSVSPFSLLVMSQQWRQRRFSYYTRRPRARAWW